MEKYLAHITDFDGKRVEQTLKDHSLNVANYARKNLESIGFGNVAYLAGLLHDMGKAKETFATYLEDSFSGKLTDRGSINHSFAGVIYILDNFHPDNEKESTRNWRLTSEIVAYAIGAHHGQFDCLDLDGNSGFSHRLKKDRDSIHYGEALNNYFMIMELTAKDIESLFVSACKEISLFNETINDNKNVTRNFYIGCLARLVLSAVVDGDRRDAAEFDKGKKDKFMIADKFMWLDQLNYLEQQLDFFPCEDSINRARKAISDECRIFALEKPGVYKLRAQTGSGKTLSSLRYALAHSEKYSKARIILVTPLLTILDQNAEVVRKYIKNKEIIHEHHSNVVVEKSGEDNEELDRYELLTDTWQSPIIISTLVQLLNVLFDEKNSSVRRMKAMINSIIVIDEVQSVPLKFFQLFNLMINFLVEFCGATVVLSSATQPCLENVTFPLRFGPKDQLLSQNRERDKVFERAKINNNVTPYGMSIDELAEFARKIIQKRNSLLIICNTKASARNLFEALSLLNEKEYEIFHLSTAMCKAHRSDVLNRIGSTPGFQDKRKVICISTQLVEAGVDFSFESVIRVIAGLDNIVQAVGRCNRNGEWGNCSDAYIVNLKTENTAYINEIRIAQDCMKELISWNECNPEEIESNYLSEEAISQYYNILFKKKEVHNILKYPLIVNGQAEDILSLLSTNPKRMNNKNYCNYEMKQAYKTAGMNIKVFDDDTTDIIVPYNCESREIISEFSKGGSKFNFDYYEKLIKKCKKYSCSIYENQKMQLYNDGKLEQVLDGRIWVLDKSAYNEETGISTNKYEDNNFICI